MWHQCLTKQPVICYSMKDFGCPYQFGEGSRECGNKHTHCDDRASHIDVLGHGVGGRMKDEKMRCGWRMKGEKVWVRMKDEKMWV